MLEVKFMYESEKVFSGRRVDSDLKILQKTR